MEMSPMSICRDVASRRDNRACSRQSTHKVITPYLRVMYLIAFNIYIYFLLLIEFIESNGVCKKKPFSRTQNLKYK
jgi:hypothetical protein